MLFVSYCVIYRTLTANIIEYSSIRESVDSLSRDGAVTSISLKAVGDQSNGPADYDHSFQFLLHLQLQESTRTEQN